MREFILSFGVRTSAILILFFSHSTASATECYLVKKHHNLPHVYSPGYGPDHDHAVSTFHSHDQELIKEFKEWQYVDENEQGKATGYRIGVSCKWSCNCSRRRCSGCARHWYVWMCVPQDKIHASYGQGEQPECDWECRLSSPKSSVDSPEALVYYHPGVVKRRDIEALWDRFKKSSCHNNLKLDDQGQQAVARSLLTSAYGRVSPKSFLQSMRYEYGYSNGIIDLQPGMRLRVDTSIWNAPRTAGAANGSAPSKTGKAVPAETGPWDGYVSTGTSYYNVVRSSRWQKVGENYIKSEFMAIKPYFGLLHYDSIPETKQPYAANFASGPIDLNEMNEESKLQYWRLVYPKKFMEWNNPKPDPMYHVLLMAAKEAKNLSDDCCYRYTKLEWQDSTTNIPALIYAIAGRSTVIPQVMVRVSARSNYVDVGTTVRNELEIRGNVVSMLAHVRLTRAYQDRQIPVVFAEHDIDLYEIPLLRGDQLRW